MPRLFVGGYRELRRPINVVDESLMRRIEEARERLRLDGIDVKPLRGDGAAPWTPPQSAERRDF